MWRGGVSPLGSGAWTIPVKPVVMGSANAESPGAGCGAGRDRMTSVLSRGSSVSRWRRWLRAWGRDEPVTDEPAARAGDDPLKDGPDIPAVHDGCFHHVRSRVPAHRRIDDATRWASPMARFASNDLWPALIDETMAQFYECAMPIRKFFSSAYRLGARAQSVVIVNAPRHTITCDDKFSCARSAHEDARTSR